MADNGTKGTVLPPPINKPRKQKNKHMQYMLCEFTSCLDKNVFHLWLSKVDAIKVSKLPAFCVSDYGNNFIAIADNSHFFVYCNFRILLTKDYF